MSENTDARPIIVGVDGSPPSIDALRKAAQLADALDAPIEAITAWQFPMMYNASFALESWSPEEDATATLADAIDAAFPSGPPERLTRSIAAGPAAGALVARSDGAEMLVLGSRGRGGFAGMLLGSVSAACAQHARCPVLIMHGPGQRTSSTVTG
ncbi:universal stress protein [Microbacterium sp. LRZ72]|uniref:universal stress protein n=1 Tax=Microbacterium sp. LRZ72 TaxID=2942481 RepID=UPI0029A147B2|nr:universal stress protein [Microbacterium sp. LRZ72]MDX2376554.1 universal stress protein [Microbacterium sp. LRZ72]